MNTNKNSTKGKSQQGNQNKKRKKVIIVISTLILFAPIMLWLCKGYVFVEKRNLGRASNSYALMKTVKEGEEFAPLINIKWKFAKNNACRPGLEASDGHYSTDKGPFGYSGNTFY